MTHTEGDSFELVCAFVAIPVPDIRWEKDGEIFPPGEGRRIINSMMSDWIFHWLTSLVLF